MKSCSAFFVLLWLTSASAQPAAPAATPIVAKSTYHPDNSHSETVVDKTTNELTEATYNAGGALISKKHYLLNERGLPTQGHIYDGRGNLVARSQVYFDEYGRAKEMRSFNLNGQCYQQVLYEYGNDGKPKTPKVVNVDPRAAPSIKPGIIDFTQNTAPPGQVVPQQQGQPQQAPAPEEPKKKSFFGRLFSKKEKK
ncbi:hypothetical protein [Prosthecobacter sp.]|uniref:hypothetical protein n=1 Tax=Prosthecobacter sp. TaxID=1965333 RepID=UPI001DCCCCAB|nr:hypothetical protein [Prosthecobacter sp.]MCB1277404.1 hypothetical protein [Prosthecobacter sp.]